MKSVPNLTDEQYDSLTLQMLGFIHAVNRFRGGGQHVRDLLPDLYAWAEDRSLPCRLDDPVNPKHVHFAQAEALERFAMADWALGEASGLGADWYLYVEDGELVPAFRFARNAVHHDRVLAIETSGFEEKPLIRSEVLRLKWASIESQRAGRRAYDEQLLGQTISLGLLRANLVLSRGALIVV